MAEIYNDSKTFVDKPLINPVDQVLFNFDVFMQACDYFGFHLRRSHSDQYMILTWFEKAKGFTFLKYLVNR